MTDPGAPDPRRRRPLIGLALMFFAPLGLAFYLYYGHGTWHPGGRVNNGELIEPARPLPSLALPLLGGAGSTDPGSTDPKFLTGKWTLLHVEHGPCSRICQSRLYDTRQVRLALDRDMNRVQRVLIADDCCDAEFLREQHPDLITIRASAAAAPLLALLPGLGSTPGAGSVENSSAGAGAGAVGNSSATKTPCVYLIDPLGNLMMFYAADARPKGMLEDLKRLLRLSSIG